MHPRKHIYLLVLLIQEILQFAHLALQDPDPLLEGFGVATREGSAAELVARLALEPDVGAL